MIEGNAGVKFKDDVRDEVVDAREASLVVDSSKASLDDTWSSLKENFQCSFSSLSRLSRWTGIACSSLVTKAPGDVAASVCIDP